MNATVLSQPRYDPSADSVETRFHHGYAFQSNEGRRHALHRALISVVLNYPDDDATFDRACGLAGLDSSTPRVGLAFIVAMPETPRHAESTLEQLMAAFAAELNLAVEELVGARYAGRLVIWAPVASRVSTRINGRRMRAHVLSLINVMRGIVGVGIGLVNVGAQGWSTSAKEALGVLNAGGCWGGISRVFSHPAPDFRLSDEQARGITSFIEAHLDTHMSLRDMANATNLSSGHFCRAFRGRFGVRPREYLMLRRVARSKHLMLSTDRSLCDIALACGMTDQAHFSRTFRREMGTTPSRWRAERRQTVADCGSAHRKHPDPEISGTAGQLERLCSSGEAA
ncbi:AraC-like DNA-binding protein [Luteibacter sp. OK325]|uniref:helix-turn-helix domain-containing protein n=1 Tax=Luteibacter sp. OK325 TaxID=2135670 RepID=UPI000D33D7A8|nr:helix-turn-helix domain-containing protein [Luteibacter sp. OK325]PTR34082.1 AraC-like DNA-binding protein [Luteibacter sp. OK325]